MTHTHREPSSRTSLILQIQFGGRRIEFYAWNQVLLQLGRLTRGVGERREATLQLRQELGDVQAQVPRPIRGEVLRTTAPNLACPLHVSVSKMVQRHRGMDQSLVEKLIPAGRSSPNVFPDFMRLKKFMRVEVFDTAQVLGFVIQFVHSSKGPDDRC